MNRTVLVVFAFVGVFLSGAITGGFIGVRSAQRVSERRAAEQFAQQQFRRLSEQLGLTAEQKQRIRPIVTKASREIQDVRRNIADITQRMESDVRGELTPEQRTKFDQVRSRMQDNERLWQRWIREQRSRRQDPWSNAVESTSSPGSSSSIPTPTPTPKPSPPPGL